MMKKIRLAGVVSLIILFTIIGCKRTLYPYPNNPLTNYYLPLQVGKYATYALDSVNFYYYGQLDTVTRYLAKDSVEHSVVDNLGDTSWVVVRYLSPATGPVVWTASETNLVKPALKSIEVVENNLRFIKLSYPMTDSFSWSGNSYLPTNPYQDFFTFSTPENLNLNNWVYTYHNVNQHSNIGGKDYDSTLTVLQYDDSTNVPIVIDTLFASRTYWSETYAKNIGMVYRHTVIWEYQPPTPNGQSGYKIGFEITMTLLDHN